ncbi:MAG: hypothetical protein KDA22_13310 [Phycisphaerales bacterium]|nr:hypothetical protein [Phycisphaerales bacterium]
MFALITASNVVAGSLVVGCAATSKGPARLGGYAVTASTSDTKALSASLYEVDADGTIAWGGGVSAQDGKTTWSGRLTDEQCRSIERLLREDGWLRREPPTSGQPESMRTVVDVSGPSGTKRWTLRGHGPELDRLLAELESVSLARLDGYLRTLPTAGDPNP